MNYKVLKGDCLDVLKTLDDNSVDCIVTSPPYYGLRDYGTGEWVGGNPDCPHYRTSKYSKDTATGHKAMMEQGEAVGDAIYKTVLSIPAREQTEVIPDKFVQSSFVKITEKRNKRDVWSVSVKSVKEAHFATFPEDLIEPCVLAGCPVGGVVLDPFCGSGTTGIVSVRNERNFIGIELNPEYAEMSTRRIEKERMQGIQVGFNL